MILKFKKDKTGINNDTGKWAEQRAQEYLTEQGLTLVARNFRCRQGEVDLIMQDSDTLVFVEVRFRKSHHYGTALDTVTQAKQLKVRKAAQMFLHQQKIGEALPMRFDVIGMTEDDIQWVKGAF